MNKYDIELIKELAKKQPKGNFNCTSIAKEYCKIKKIDYQVSQARNIQRIIKKNEINGGGGESARPHLSIEYIEAAGRKTNKSSKVFIITYAQAHTPIDKRLWKNILKYAKKVKATIVVIPGTYLNPNSEFKKTKHTWDKELLPYIYSSENRLFKHLQVIPDADILPTASMPLMGMESITGIESSIVGHPRQHKMIVPTLKTSRRKLMATTGAVTVPNYRRARVGKKAITHHKMGFLIAEAITDDDFVMRHVEAEKNGSFQDLIFRVEDGVVTADAKWEAIVNGDTHLSKEDREMLEETKRLVEIGKPTWTIWHDLLDGYSINHHNSKDFVTQVINEKKGLNSLSDEIEMSYDFIREWKHTNMVIIPSNHNDWLDKWVRFSQGEKDAKNAFLFNDFRSILYNELAPKGLYAYLIDEEFGGEVLTLGRDTSFMIAGHECNNHGDLGSNGAKGTPVTFKRLNTRIVSGDKHFLYTYDNAFGVGVTTRLDHGYNRGMSSWIQASGLIHSNGTFQHLIFAGGKFTNLF